MFTVHELRRALEECTTNHEELLAAATDRIEALEAALAWYADEANWRPTDTTRHSVADTDRGARAHAALRGEKVIEEAMQGGAP